MGTVTDLSEWEPSPIGSDPVGEYARTGARGVRGQRRGEPYVPRSGIHATVLVPGAIGISFHFVDYVVHGWDVAKSIGVDPEYSDEMAEAVLPLALAFQTPAGDV